jgi:hypothetical protein
MHFYLLIRHKYFNLKNILQNSHIGYEVPQNNEGKCKFLMWNIIKLF